MKSVPVLFSSPAFSVVPGAGGALLAECLPAAEAALLGAELSAVEVRRLGWLAPAPENGPVTLAAALSGRAGGPVVALADEERLREKIALLRARHALSDPGTERLSIVLPIAHAESFSLATAAETAEAVAVSARFGARHLEACLNRVMDACDRQRLLGFSPRHHPPLAAAVAEARSLGVPESLLHLALLRAAEGDEGWDAWPSGFLAEEETETPPAFSLALNDDFVEAALTGHGFDQQGAPAAQGGVRHADAADLFARLVDHLWVHGRPGLVFSDKVPPLAAAPVIRQAAALPLSACAQVGRVDIEKLRALVRVLTAAAAARVIDVPLAQRQVILHVTDLAPMLMRLGAAYESLAGRSLAAAVVALVRAEAVLTLARLAQAAGLSGQGARAGARGIAADLLSLRARLAGDAFAGAGGVSEDSVSPAAVADKALVRHVASLLEEAAAAARDQGLLADVVIAAAAPMAAQAALAVTGPDVQPLASLLAEEPAADPQTAATPAYRQRLSAAAAGGLRALGYTAAQCDDIYFYIAGQRTLLGAPAIHHESLRRKGFDEEALARVERALATARRLDHAVHPAVLGMEWCAAALGLSPLHLEGAAFSLLRWLGFDEDEIAAADLYACGAGGVQGAPHLSFAHLPVFDTATPDPAGGRTVTPAGMLAMQAAVEAAAGGPVRQVLRLHPETGREDIRALLLKGWDAGVRALVLDRAGAGFDTPVVPLDLGPAGESVQAQAGPMLPAEIKQ